MYRLRLANAIEDILTVVLLALGFQIAGAVRSAKAYLLTIVMWFFGTMSGHILIGVNLINSERIQILVLSALSASLILVAQKIFAKHTRNQSP